MAEQDDLKSSLRLPLEFMEGTAGASAENTQVGTTAAPRLHGADLTVLEEALRKVLMSPASVAGVASKTPHVDSVSASGRLRAIREELVRMSNSGVGGPVSRTLEVILSDLERLDREEAEPSAAVSRRPLRAETGLGDHTLSSDADRTLAADRYAYLESEFERALRAGRKAGLVQAAARLLKALELVVSDMEARSFLYLEQVFHPEISEYRRGFKLHHCVNVAILSTVLGESLGFSKLQLLELALAGLLHDVGMLERRWDYLLAGRELLERETKILRTHPLEAGRWLGGDWRDFPAVSVVAVQHHEREDGSGYPYRLRGDDLHPYSKVVGLADALEAFTHERPHRAASTARAFFAEYRAGRSLEFHASVWKAAFEAVGPYPPGTKVELASGARGVVVALKRGQPLAPLVRTAQARSTGKAPLIELNSNPLYRIARVLD